MRTLAEYEIKSVNIEQSNYPKILKDLSDPPKQIYYRGVLDDAILSDCIAIIGSRRMTRYGRLVTEQISTSLVGSGYTIISGFMYGVDEVAHSTTVGERGKTIAVMGSGINCIYPPDHDKLYTLILNNGGAVLSEFEPEQKPKPWMYAKRNRVVAGLANKGIIVIEASVKSGSLITADFANKLQRRVYAVPGPINSSTSEGTNWLIKNGKAKMFTSVKDILGKEIINKNNSSPTQLSPAENKIFKVLKSEGTPLSMDEIVTYTQMDITEVSVQISIMNLKGVVVEFDGKYSIV